MPPKKRKTNRWFQVAIGVLAVAAIIVVPIAAACIAARKRTVDEMEIPELEILMNNAADMEDYSMAAFYRDKIKEKQRLRKPA